MLKKRKKSIITFIAIAVLCFNSVFALWSTNEKVALAGDVTKVEDVTFEMKTGASVRYATTAEESGLRFAATMPKSDYEALQKSGYAELSFGILIMPYNYIARYGALTVENVFGDSAVYDWATLDEDGKWVYSGTKTRIINLASGKMTVDKEDENLYVVNGSITAIMENNLARDYVGVGYIQYKESDTSDYSYRLAEYTDNNARSIVEVSEAVYEDSAVTEENKALVKEYYIDATDVRCVKFFDGDDILEIHKSFTEYYFDGIPVMEEDGHKFSHWVDADGVQVDIVEDETEVTKTMKLYATFTTADGIDYVTEGYLGVNGKIMATINEFLTLDVTAANVASALTKYEEVVAMLAVPRAREYNELITTSVRENINEKIAEINAVLEESDDLYETFTGVISDEQTYSCLRNTSTSISLPLINYSLLKEVTFSWSTSAWLQAGYGEHLWFYDTSNSLGGTVTIQNHGDGTLTLIMAETTVGDGTYTVTVTDEDIISGKSALELATKTVSTWSDETFTVGEITATSLYDFTSIEDTVVLYTGQDLIDNVSVQDASGNVPYSESASSLIDGGVNYDCSGTSATVWTVTLPKIAYSSYNTVSLTFQATNTWQTFGFVGGGTIADGGGSAMSGTITFTNDGESVIVVINDTANSKSVSYTITDADVIAGTKAFTLYWNQGAQYRQMSFGPISATTSINGRLAAAAENGKTPKLVETMLYMGQDLIDNVSVQDASGNVPYSESASSLIDGGVNYDCSGTSATVWTVTLPKIAYSSYNTVSLTFQATNTWQTFGFVGGGTIADGGGSAMSGTITFTNDGESVIVVINDTANSKSVSYTITDADVMAGMKAFTLYWNQGAQYRQMSFGPISATAQVSADSVDVIGVADKEVAIELPYYNISGKTLYAGESLINNVSVTPEMKVNSYNDYFANAVQFDPEGTKVTATISLPLINYANCEKVTMDFKGRNAGQKFGFSSTDYIADSGNDSSPFDGTITIVTNEDGTLTGEIVDTITGNSVTATITDTDIVNGTEPLTFYWDSGSAYRQILIGPISCDTTGRVTTSPHNWYTLLDFNKSTYEVNATDLTDESREILVRRDLTDNTKLYVETQKSDSSETRTYAVELPWISYNKYHSLKTTIASNNGYAGLASDSAFYSTASEVDLEMEYNDGVLTIALGDSVSECTDEDVLNGRKGLTIYVQGSQYTMTYLAEFMAMGKTTPVSSGAQAQTLDLAARSGSTEVSEYRIAYDANGAYGDTEYYKWVAEEMKFFLEEMTGITFRLVGVHDASVISNTSKYIVIGEKLAEEMGVETFDLTQTNGYNVKQDYKNLYIYGESPRGTMNGVYGFLEDIAGLVSYTDEVYTYDYEGLDITSGYSKYFNPSFNMGITGYAEAQYTKEYYARLGLSNDGYIGTGTTVNSDGKTTAIGTHCMLDILPYDTYGRTYPEWYTDDETMQINFTSTNTSIDTMRGIVVESMKEAIEAFPAHTYFVFGQPDSSSYAPDMAGYLDFMNQCSEEIDTWLQAEDADRKVSLCMFAYTAGIEAPESGSFYNGTCAETAVIFAPVGARYTHLLTETYHKNSTTQEWTDKTVAELLQEWNELEGANIHFWLYGTDYYNYMMPMDTITNMKANYQYVYQFGTDAIHFQLQTYTQDNTGSDWQRLKTYLSAALTKDVNADVDTLQDNFMNAMYGAGADNMKALLKAQQAYVTYDNFNKKDSLFAPNNTELFFGVINGSDRFFDTGVLAAEYFAEDTLLTWMSYINVAKAAVEADGTITEEEKALLLENIEVESLSIRYMLIVLHDNTTYDESESAWTAAANTLGCVALKE